MSKNQQISYFLGFYFIIGTPLSQAMSYLLQYDHVIPAADARRLINTHYLFIYLFISYNTKNILFTRLKRNANTLLTKV